MGGSDDDAVRRGLRGRLPSLSRPLAAVRRPRASASTLVVPVPEAEFVYERWTGDRAQVGVPGLPMHVTVLFPFIAPSEIDAAAEHQLEQLARAHLPFD